MSEDSPAGGKPGRPTTYTPELAAEIVARLTKGEPLAAICRDEHMPAVRTVSSWKSAHEDFLADFARARDDGFDAIAADCLDIADDGSADYRLSQRDGSAELVVDQEHIQRSKLRIETRLKLLAKWDPRRYGDKIIHAGDEDAPLVSRVQLVGPDE